MFLDQHDRVPLLRHLLATLPIVRHVLHACMHTLVVAQRQLHYPLWIGRPIGAFDRLLYPCPFCDTPSCRGGDACPASLTSTLAQHPFCFVCAGQGCEFCPPQGSLA